MTKKFTNSDYTNDRHAAIRKILKLWKPRVITKRNTHPVTEKEWKHSLNEHLRECLPDANVNVERIASGRQSDILIEFAGGWFGGKVKDVIEIKRADNLASGRNYDGLQTQIRDYLADGKSNVFVVLCGTDLDERYPRELKTRYQKWGNDRLSIFWKRGFETGDVRTVVFSSFSSEKA